MARRLLQWLDTRRLVTAITFIALFAMAVRAPTDTDTWWHLQAGKVTIDSGHILETDLFSHTRYGSPWVNHSWLSQIILYLLFADFSYAGLGLFIGVVVVLAFVFVYGQMEGDPFFRAFVIVLAGAVSGVIWMARPQLLSFLGTAIVCYLLYLFKWQRVNRLWLLPPLFALWCNLHAGYALGFMVLVAFVAGEVFNHVLESRLPSDDPVVDWKGIATVVAVSVVSVLVLVVNPNTTRMWTYYLDTVKVGVLQDFIQEWQSPNFHPLYTQPFIWLLLATLGAIGLSRRRVDGTDLALVTVFAYAALVAGRNIGPCALVAAPVLSRHGKTVLDRLGLSIRARPNGSARMRTLLGGVNWSILIVLIALAVLKVQQPLSDTFNEELQRESLPVGATDWIEAHEPQGKMFNHYNWGGYLIYRLWPEYLVFVDGRTDLYGDEILRDYVEIQRGGPEAVSLLDEYGVSFVVTKTGDSLSTLLECRDDWALLYQDQVAVILGRQR